MDRFPNRDSVDMLFQANLQEFATLRDELLKREELTSQIQIYTVIAIGILIPLIQYVESESILGHDTRNLILLAAILFCALGWYQLDLDDRKADIDNYILQILTPKLEALISGISPKNFDEIPVNKLFEWQLYWRTNRYGSTRGFWLGLGVVGRTGVTIISAILLLLYYIYTAHIITASPWSLISIILVSITCFGVIWMIITALFLRNKYAKATKIT
jgi:hypothetical protein